MRWGSIVPSAWWPQPVHRVPVTRATPSRSSRCSHARSSGVARNDCGKTRPLDPTNVGSPKPTHQARRSAGPNASIACSSRRRCCPYRPSIASMGSLWVRFSPLRPASNSLRPTDGMCSTTVTRRPAVASTSAAISPPGPPPTTSAVAGSAPDDMESELWCGERLGRQGLAAAGAGDRARDQRAAVDRDRHSPRSSWSTSSERRSERARGADPTRRWCSAGRIHPSSMPRCNGSPTTMGLMIAVGTPRSVTWMVSPALTRRMYSDRCCRSSRSPTSMGTR